MILAFLKQNSWRKLESYLSMWENDEKLQPSVAMEQICIFYFCDHSTLKTLTHCVVDYKVFLNSK